MTKVRSALVLAATALVAASYLFAVRQALPRWVRGLVVLTIAVKVITTPLPFDGGIDEVLMAVTGMVLWFRHRTLVRACWHAAEMERK